MSSENKVTLRSDLKQKRHLFSANAKKTSFFQGYEDLFYAFLQNTLKVSNTSVIGGYWPLEDEADCRPLLISLFQRGFPCALPTVEDKEAPLSFRAWTPDDRLTSCPYFTNLLQPLQNRPLLTPRILFVPFLGFDKYGHRLGYGGGFYDKTLHHLRHLQKEPLTAIGFGFAMQEIDAVPITCNDEPLDWILTEQGIKQVLR